MASNLGEVTVKVNLEASEELRAFVRAEVRKVLNEELQHVLRQQARAYMPPRLETKVMAPSRHEELPAWARQEGGTAH